MGGNEFQIDLSAPLVLKYEQVAERDARALGRTHADIDDGLDCLCAVGEHHRIHFPWRPVLRAAQDDKVLELAVEAASDCIVTHNVRDFEGAAQFGVRVLTPSAFLKRIGVGP
jgi:hypothetical protein